MLEVILLRIYDIYKWVIQILGHMSLFIMISFIFYKIYENIMIKKTTKKFAKELMKNKFMDEALKPMTEEEKNNLKENKKTETKITLNFGDMSVTKENK